MKILHLQQFVYPYRLPLFEMLAEKLEIDIIFCNDKRSFREWAVQVPENAAYGGEILGGFQVGPLRLSTGLFHYLRKKYDVYSVAALDWTTFFQFMCTLVAAKASGKPFIMFDEFLVTDFYRHRRKVTWTINFLLRKFVYPHVDAFVIWNKVGANFLRDMGVPERRIFCGPQILPGDYDGLRSRAAGARGGSRVKPEGEISVLYVGSLIERKGVDTLVRAFRALPQGRARLAIVGKGEAESALRSLAEGDSRIAFLGHLEGDRKRDAFASADIFVVPSLHEPWGFVVNEALEFGLPILTTTAVGAADYLVEDNGMILPPGDVAALKAALEALIEDPMRLQAMGRASELMARKWTLDDMAEPFYRALEYVMKQRGHSTARLGAIENR